MNKSEFKKFESWLNKLGKAWSERNPKAAASLLSKSCKYYESVFEKQCRSWNDILKLWQAVPHNQKNVKFKFKIIAVSDKICVANWHVARTMLPGNEKQLIDGIFQISLNKKGACTYFKQWRSVKRI